MDFTIEIYKRLLNELIKCELPFFTFDTYLKSKKDKLIILRHDVDSLPSNSLLFAKIQADLGIKGTYYFRTIPQSWNEKIILKIADLGHEVGFHYETMDTANGNIDEAFDQFKFQLEKLRELVNVTTICMHGSPRSKFDNKDLWSKYDYKSLGIAGEPYFDVDFNQVLYLTDTGRKWDGWKTSIRDTVPQQSKWIDEGLTYHSTTDIIDASSLGVLPSRVMFTFHPQRWHSRKIPWIKEFVLQNIKNQIKKFLIK